MHFLCIHGEFHVLIFRNIIMSLTSLWNFRNDEYTTLKALESDPRLGTAGRIIEYVVSRGFNSWTVQSIPIGFAVPILSSIYECRISPPLSGSYLGWLVYLFILFQPSRGKSLLELWVTNFLSDRQPPLIFVRFVSNFLCMCSINMASAHVILK